MSLISGIGWNFGQKLFRNNIVDEKRNNVAQKLIALIRNIKFSDNGISSHTNNLHGHFIGDKAKKRISKRR